MESNRFDNLTRSFGLSRRGFLKTLAAGILGGAVSGSLTERAGAVVCRAGGVLCALNVQCCSGVCDPATHQCTCLDGQLLCRDRCIPACTALDACHAAGTCDPESGQCTDPPAAQGISCGAAASCSNGVATVQATCDGNGNCAPGSTIDCAPYVCGGTSCLTSCTSTADCAGNHYCNDGVCTTLAPNGTNCTSPGQCQSGFCADGVCCDSSCSGQCEACDVSGNLGSCTAVTGSPLGGRPACSSDGSVCGGTCNGSNTQSCTYPGTSTSCRATSCSNGTETLAASCTGVGACAAVQTKSCTPYGCGSTSCLTSCTGDADCASGHYCHNGNCLAQQASGTQCTATNQCTSGNCVDGFCCNSACAGQCEACDVTGHVGTCTAVTGEPHGARTACTSDGSNCGGLCDGLKTQGCTYPGSTTDCGAGPTCTNDTATAQATCNGAGICGTGVSTPCVPYACGATNCLTSCTTAADCASGNYCSGSTCVAQLANGNACTAAGQCASGNCVDGYCCNTACIDQCAACNIAGQLGICSPAPKGEPIGGRPACPGSGTTCGGSCDGTDTTCTYSAAGTVCLPGACANGEATGQGACDGVGNCTPGSTVACTPYACNSDGTACTASCTSSADCASGAVCCSGACITGSCCADADCTDANLCTTDTCDLTTHTCTHTAVTPGTSCGKFGQTCCGTVCLGTPCDASQCQTCDPENGSCVTCAGQTGQITCIFGVNGEAGTCCQVGEVCISNNGSSCCTGTEVCTVNGCCVSSQVCGTTAPICCSGTQSCDKTSGTCCTSVGNTCAKNGDCCPGTYCLAGTCQVPCSPAGGLCANPSFCSNGCFCLPRNDGGAFCGQADLGSRCLTDADCAQEAQLVGVPAFCGHPGGCGEIAGLCVLISPNGC